MANQQEILDEIAELKTMSADQAATLTKVSGETTACLQKISDLENQIANMPPSADLDAIKAGLDDLKGSMQTVSDLATGVDTQVPDSPQP